MKCLKIGMLMCLMFLAGAASAVVVNVDFGPWNQNQVVPSGLYVGLGACPDAGANTFWNHAGRGWEGQLAGNNLKASDNVATTTISFIFGANATDFTCDYNPAGPNYTGVPNLLLADGRRPSTVVAPADPSAEVFTITGLTANKEYALFLYGGNLTEGLGTVFTFNGVTGQTTGVMGTELIEGDNYVLLVVTSDATGQIIGTFAPETGNTDCAFNGFQITDVIPATRGAAHTPVPANGSLIDKAGVTSVSWYSPEQDKTGALKDDPNIVSVNGYDVYFRTTEPNNLTDTPKSTNQAGQSWTITPALDYNTNYYWRVDTHVTWDSNSFTGTASTTGIVKGNEWSFKTKPLYIAPTVTFGNVRTALPLLPATVAPVITNNTLPITSVVFTLLDGDYEFPTGANAVLTDTTTNLQAPTATLTTDKIGKYKIKVAVADGTSTVESMAEVMVYVDGCAARKAVTTPAWAKNYYDIDGDCLVDELTGDLTDFVLQWLNDTGLKTPMPYVKAGEVLAYDILVQGENNYRPTDPNYYVGGTAITTAFDASGGSFLNYLNGATTAPVAPAELVTYEVVVPTTGAYTLTFRAWHEFNRQATFYLVTAVSPDGNPANDTVTALGAAIAMNQAGGFAWRTYTLSPVNLTAGTSLIRLTNTAQYDFGIDYIGFKKN